MDRLAASPARGLAAAVAERYHDIAQALRRSAARVWPRRLQPRQACARIPPGLPPPGPARTATAQGCGTLPRERRQGEHEMSPARATRTAGPAVDRESSGCRT